jgi:hypothetical protein
LFEADSNLKTYSRAEGINTVFPTETVITQTSTPTSTATTTPTEVATLTPTASATETPTQTPTPDDPNTTEGVFKQLLTTEVIIPSAGNFLVIDRLSINSPITPREIVDQKTMETPLTPEEVSSYDFSFLTGLDDQVVLAGHLSFVGSGPAVFARLNELVAGDTIQIISDGKVSNYIVVKNTTIDMPFSVDTVVRETQYFHGVTLITCAGEFSLENHYSQRQIVQAISID